MENIYKRKVNKSLIPTCNIMGVNIAAINMEWLVSYLNENLEDIKGDYAVYKYYSISDIELDEVGIFCESRT